MAENKRKLDEPSPQPDGKHGSSEPTQVAVELAKQRAQEIAARLFSAAEAKRPRVENGSESSAADTLPKFNVPSVVSQTPLSSYGYGTSKKIEIPNGKVGVIIGKAGETIKYLQLQSGAKIQVTRDMDADPGSQTRSVELIGTSEQISKAEQLISDVLQEAEAGGSGLLNARKSTPQLTPGSEQFQMKVPNNKVGLVIGKGGETIKTMQAKSGARIQVIPLHLPPGDTSTERTVYIDGTKEQIEAAKQLVNEVISSEVRGRSSQSSGGYQQQGYRPPRPPTSWAPQGGPAPPAQQPGYGYMQPGAYPNQPPQYLSQPPYAGYPPPQAGATAGYQPSWDQSSNAPTQQTNPGAAYDYYNQQQQQQQQQQQPVSGSAPGAAADNPAAYNYGQQSAYGTQGSYGDSSYSQPNYGQTTYSGPYAVPAGQQAYQQQLPAPQGGYEQQQGYSTAPPYGTVSNPQDGSQVNYGTQTGINQAPPVGQGTTPAVGYGPPMTSQPAYGTQPPAQAGYPPAPGAQAGYAHPTPPHSYAQPQPGQGSYGQDPASGQAAGYASIPAYGSVPPGTQPGYAQPQAYGGASGAYSQPPAYSGEAAAHGSYDQSAAAAPTSAGGMKASPS